MKKIPTLFVRDATTKLVTREANPLCSWVMAGEGVATRKLDGTACLVRDGRLYKRREIKNAKLDALPDGFELREYDENTGKAFGWFPVADGPEDRWHREAFDPSLPDGTYELLGPKVQRNPEGYLDHVLVPHGAIALAFCPRDYDKLRAYLDGSDIEGVVWWRDPGVPDCDKAKLKLKDFGFKRGRP